MHVQRLRSPFPKDGHDAAVAQFVSADDLSGHGADAKTLQDVLLAHLKVVGARPYLRRQLMSPLAVDNRELVWPGEAEVDEGQTIQLCRFDERFGRFPTKCGDAHRKSSRLNTFRAINVES